MLVPFESIPSSLSRQNSSVNSSPKFTLSRQRSNGWSDMKAHVMPFKNEKLYTLIKMNQTSEDNVIFLYFFEYIIYLY